MKSLDLGNLGGTLYYKELPILNFKFKKNKLVSMELLVEKDCVRLPVEFRLYGVSGNNLVKFFEARITPSTRQGLDEFLAQTPVKYYYPERIIRYNSGRCIHDYYWVECDDDNSCWE